MVALGKDPRSLVLLKTCFLFLDALFPFFVDFYDKISSSLKFLKRLLPSLSGWNATWLMFWHYEVHSLQRGTLPH
jgi:hypothetical protein